jgi:mono/diheme cytochrome c family protein
LVGYGTLQAATDFARDIEPILIRRCSECHGPDKQKGDLRLDTRAAALKAAKSGRTAVVPGNSAGSGVGKQAKL